MKIVIKKAAPPKMEPIYPFRALEPGMAFEVNDLSKHDALRSAAWRFGRKLGAKFRVHKKGKKITVYRVK